MLPTRTSEGRSYVVLVLAALWLLSLSRPAMSWGSEGHRIVAEIAEQYLTPETAKQVRDLLAIENAITLADVANWADQIRPQRRETAPWHFVDIPVSASAYDANRDCPSGDCVVAKIGQFATQLGDGSLPPQQRLEALKFIVHFVGDLHQPLHASDNEDRGGNEIRVTFLGHSTNLHAVWDTAILAPVVNGDERAYALRLTRYLTDKDVSSWGRGSTIDWANESHAVAVRSIYGDLPHASGPLPASYEQAALPIVNQQLERAGIRLAAVLNSTLIGAESARETQLAQAANLSAQDAATHIGETATVCGTVASTNYAVRSRGRPTFLNLDKPYPSEIFTVLIWGDNRDQFGSPETSLMGKRICTTGVIELYRNRPEIVVRSPSQLHQE